MKRKNHAVQQVFIILIYLVIGFACGLLFFSYASSQFQPDQPLWMFLLSFVLLLLVMYLAIFLQILLHEAGHLVFGLLSGYRFFSFRFMSLMWVKENDRILFRQLAVAGTGGQCLMSPPEDTEGRRPFLLYNLGGSLMNFLTGLVCLLLSLLVAMPAVLSMALKMMAVIGFSYALLNALPLRTDTVDTDGYNALSLLRSRDSIPALWLQLKITEQTARGIRLKDMPAEWFVMPSEDKLSNTMEAAVAVFCCNRLIDEHRFDEAAAQTEHLLATADGLAGLYRSLLQADLLYCELIGANRPEQVQARMTDELRRFMKTMRRYPAVLRTEYTYALLAEQKPEKASRIRTLFDQVASTYPYPADVESERSLLDLADARSQSL